MAYINLYESYNNKRRKFGVNDANRFRDSYVEAVNMVYAELNDQVFQNQTLEYIGSFDDIIDERLFSFTSLTFDSPSIAAMESREFWSISYDFERTSDTNGLTDTIVDDASNVVLSIADGVFSVVGASVSATATIPSVDTFTLTFASTSEGCSLEVNGAEVALAYTVGDSETAQGIGAITSRVINGVSGYTLNRTSFNSDGMLLMNFLLNEGTGTSVSDEVSAFNGGTAYVGTLVSPVWKQVYIQPSSGLDSQYRSVFDMGIDYHLQDGGEWAIENEAERERKWYSRGIPMARNVLQNNTTYTNPLGI
jgi:hypothetical protein